MSASRTQITPISKAHGRDMSRERVKFEFRVFFQSICPLDMPFLRHTSFKKWTSVYFQKSNKKIDILKRTLPTKLRVRSMSAQYSTISFVPLSTFYYNFLLKIFSDDNRLGVCELNYWTTVVITKVSQFHVRSAVFGQNDERFNLAPTNVSCLLCHNAIVSFRVICFAPS